MCYSDGQHSYQYFKKMKSPLSLSPQIMEPYGIRNPGNGSGQAQTCDRVKLAKMGSQRGIVFAIALIITSTNV
jgi:hypothetical protein